MCISICDTEVYYYVKFWKRISNNKSDSDDFIICDLTAVKVTVGGNHRHKTKHCCIFYLSYCRLNFDYIPWLKLDYNVMLT